MGEDIQLPPLTPNSLLFVNTNLLQDVAPYHLEEKERLKEASKIFTEL
jgi:hypothetical protein